MQNTKIAVVGLGYVGLPLAALFSTRYSVVGYDLNDYRVRQIMNGEDITGELGNERLSKAIHHGLVATSHLSDIANCNVYIVAVPTPVDHCHQPDLTPLKSASKQVGHVLKPGDIVIYESTVYPGATEETCVPILERESGLKYNVDFFAGYSPERINPGDREHTVETIKKITSGSTPEIADRIDELYNSVLLNGTYRAPNIKVAEAAKIIENTQRDVNIAFMNEIAIIFQSLGIDIEEVISAASTKWNFLSFHPGLVGGHCIGVDPYYLIHRAEMGGLKPRLITEARTLNDSMGHYIGKQIIDQMLAADISTLKARVLIAGFTFKPDCPDTRNTKVMDVYHTLSKYIPNIDVYDPHAIPQDVKREYGIDIITDMAALQPEAYDVVALCVHHAVMKGTPWDAYLKPQGIIYDLFPRRGEHIARSAVKMSH